MVNIIYYSANPTSPAKFYWDQALIDDILSDSIFSRIPGDNGAIFIIPGAYQAKYIDDINEKLSFYSWVILFITSDEESKFPIEKINHPNLQVYIQYPKQGRHDKYKKFPLGYTLETRKLLKLEEKDLNYFFGGQITHKRREEMAKQLQVYAVRDPKGKVHSSKGFAEGMNSEEYMDAMNRAKVVPSPAGPVSADAFRTYEAMEAGAVPIADNISAGGDRDYIKYLFGEVPFPTINDYKDLPGYIEDQLALYPQINNRVQAWWIKKKRDLKVEILADIQRLSGNITVPTITAIVPVSPIKSHPSTEILDQTIASIRHHLPTAEIIITFDGIREEQESKREDYEKFIQKALFKCNTEWNAIPMVFHKHTHQAGMLREALSNTISPLVLYVEQDTPLVTDMAIPWDSLTDQIMNLTANVIRFHFESRIPREHKHLMLGEMVINPGDLHLMRTIQWSQRPHLIATDFYRHLINNYFSKYAKCFIEDRLHGLVQQDYYTMAERGWELWKLFIYYPEGSIKRSVHLDGREGERKYDGDQQF